MKFKTLTAHTPEEVQDEIERFKHFCHEQRIIDIKVTGNRSGFVIIIVYE